MTREQLELIAKREFHEAIGDMRKRGASPGPRFTFWRDLAPERMPFPEKAEQLMSDGASKEIIFAWLRRRIRSDQSITGFSFAAECWTGRTTREGEKHIAEMNDTCNTGMEEWMRRGWIMRSEAALVQAQSAEYVVQVMQPFQRDNRGVVRWLEEPKLHTLAQAANAGRSKMWGDERLMCGSPDVQLLKASAEGG